ncbi:ATP-binding cassette domain-containing protein [Cohnella faecalis]|uniref:ATP-binding cassette domain-containing protein n=1 Tax=Cohnella faecalis TaxID=2315694 RepID=A0A398CZU9_9BACL|nr:ATP-binding cassette domain-containing protein [Cohnella faecalis]RIE05387.1 ATP-binding cassette domain-containing protein [Cohnella faecalis]
MLQNVSVVFKQGTTTALVGPSGGGKSTLLKLVLGLYEPEAGDIRIGSVAIDRQTLGTWRKKTAYVPQDTTLFDASVFDNIRVGRLNATPEEIRFHYDRLRLSARRFLDGAFPPRSCLTLRSHRYETDSLLLPTASAAGRPAGPALPHRAGRAGYSPQRVPLFAGGCAPSERSGYRDHSVRRIGWRAIRHSLASYRQLGIGVRQQSGDPLSVLRDAHCACTPRRGRLRIGAARSDGRRTSRHCKRPDGNEGSGRAREGRLHRAEPGMRIGWPKAIAGLKRNEEARKAMGAAAAAKAKQYDASACADRYAEALRPAWVNAL